VLKECGPAGEVIDAYIGVAHEDRHDEGEHGARWGSGEGRVELIEVLDSEGRPTSQVRTGDRVTFRFHYDIPDGIERPVLGMAIHTLEGLAVSGPNIRDAGLVPDRLKGTGYIDLVVPKLLLLPGTYDISVALTDYSFLHPYDHRHRAHRFDVELGEPRETQGGGIVSMAGHWEVSEGGVDR
jgi:ABC-2 type transport system ATP-binding protein